MREGCLANVAGVVLSGPGASGDAVRAIAQQLARLCEDVLVVGDPAEIRAGSGSAAAGIPARTISAPEGSSLSRLAAGLAASTAARVLVVEASGEAPPAELLLALTAWPESDAVIPDRRSLASAGTNAPLCCAIFRRQPALAAARLRLAAGERDCAGLLAQLAAVALEPADLAAIAGAG